jgi:ubiquinone/menaquinone biosynthesis C-methylase UbiE
MLQSWAMNSKEYFFDQVIKEIQKNTNKPIRVLELGCGTAPYVKTLIEMYPNLEYVGVEPITASFTKAQQNLLGVPRSKVFLQLGYGSVEGIDDESFDIVISFSVLEHVKQLDRFIEMAARYTKKDGLMVHRYDLGHALYPTNIKEKVHVWLGNTIPAILPERTFVRYVPQIEVAKWYQKYLGQQPYKYTYHQMPNAKLLAKSLRNTPESEEALETLYAWEFSYAKEFEAIELHMREKLFPTVAVWGKRV